MLQSEYDVIVRHKRLKIFLIVLTAIMLVAVFLFVRKQFMMVNNPPMVVSEPPKPDVLTLPDPVLQEKKSFELHGAELEAFLRSDPIEAQGFRASMEFQSSQK